MVGTVIAKLKFRAAVAALAAAISGQAAADDLLRLAIGQRGLWDSSIAEIGQAAGIFRRRSLELQTVYTSGGGETQQAVISGSVDIGVAAGTLGVLGAFAKGAPIRIIAGEATGTAEYYFVRSDSPVGKDFAGVTPNMTLAYSTAGSGTHITGLRFMKERNFTAKLTATGSVPATFTQVMSGQVDIGFSTPPFGLDAIEAGQIRLIALANDLPSVRNQTVRVIIANATDLARRREVYDRFIRAYGETIEWMYADDQAIAAFARYATISSAMARRVRDNFYPKAMLQLDRVMGLAELIEDAIAFKYVAQVLTPAQTAELLQMPMRP
ncbi:MAG TPA: ABC transporter substrate-binding protein [Xanthobacteraceae bacterium]|nr:ABC transporter substrate-binding protein [Xanthobacteraceae bacterium]